MYEDVYFQRMCNAVIAIDGSAPLDAIRTREKCFYEEDGLAMERQAFVFVVRTDALPAAALRLGQVVGEIVPGEETTLRRIIAPIAETIGDRNALTKIYTE